jgi:hypothetical protein
MYAGQRQCNAVLPAGFANRGFSCVLSLDPQVAAGELHYRDPEAPKRLTRKVAFELFRRSYASWFELAGDTELAEWCRKPFVESRAPRLQLGERVRHIATITTENPLPQMIAEALGFEPHGAIFALDERVADGLFSSRLSRDLNWPSIREESETRRQAVEADDTRERDLFFPDGTMILRA